MNQACDAPVLKGRVRVLYSFPHKLGGGRINRTAWYQVTGLAAAGADVTVFPAAIKTQVPPEVRVHPTLARGKFRIPYRAIGHMRAYALHDWIVSREIKKLKGQIDIVHCWPLGAIRTLAAASELGIPTVLERPNPHTGAFYEMVSRECANLGIVLPDGHEHAFNAEVLRREYAEYAKADRLLCPSEFVKHTFINNGFAPEKLARHQYGFDDSAFYATPHEGSKGGLRVLFAGTVAPVKGLHYALQAWIQSKACTTGEFVIAGTATPEYSDKIASLLVHPSIRLLGQSERVPELMRASDVLVLPSIAEGAPLVVAEAIGSGCVPLVSNVCTGMCRHMENALIHRVGDVTAIRDHFDMLSVDRDLLANLRAGCLRSAPDLTWAAAGIRLLSVYRETINACTGQSHLGFVTNKSSAA